MRDFKYAKLITDNPRWDSMLKELNDLDSPILKESAKAFASNIQRTASFAILPVEIFFQSSRNTRMTANAVFKALGIGAMTLREQMELSPTAEMQLEFAKEAGEYERMDKAVEMKLRYDIGVTWVERFLEGNENMRASIDALMTSIVLESWLFFETLCADVWVASVNNGGPLISGRIRMNQKWEKSEMLASSVPASQSNPKTHPGSFYRETGMVSFQKLRSIKDYYKVLFGNDVLTVFDVVSGGYIYALSAVRNCITHCAGRIDAMFIKATERFSDWKGANINDPLLLDGEIVKDLRNAALETGLTVLKHADSALREDT
jgi:hypothetical protein